MLPTESLIHFTLLNAIGNDFVPYTTAKLGGVGPGTRAKDMLSIASRIIYKFPHCFTQEGLPAV